MWNYRSRSRFPLESRPVASALAAMLPLMLAQPVDAGIRDSKGFKNRIAHLDRQATTEHFAVHYTVAPGHSDSTTDESAQLVAQNAEQAYELEVNQWGYPPPLNDGDGRTDIYIRRLSGARGVTARDEKKERSSAYLTIEPGAGDTALLGHELFHALQDGMWRKTNGFWTEAIASWAGATVGQKVPYEPFFIRSPELSLDCYDPAGGSGACAHDSRGYARWVFFEYLAQRFGNGFLKSVYDAWPQFAGEGIAVPLNDALSNRGSSPAKVFNDFAVANMSGGYARPQLRGVGQPERTITIRTRPRGRGFSTSVLHVDHLASRYVGFRPYAVGTNCRYGRLRLRVSLPQGMDTRPYFYAPRIRKKPIPLQVSGRRAVASVKWPKCGSRLFGILNLTNPSTTAEAQPYRVRGSFTPPRSKK